MGDQSNQHGLGISILERLKKQYINLCQSGCSPYLKFLSTNYRCHSKIVDFLSRRVYEHRIDCAVKIQPHPAAKEFPCVFYWCESRKAEYPMKHEAEAVLRQVKHYFLRWPLEWKDIKMKEACIISPFRAQV